MAPAASQNQGLSDVMMKAKQAHMIYDGSASSLTSVPLNAPYDYRFSFRNLGECSLLPSPGSCS
jgi:hypothetical protein